MAIVTINGYKINSKRVGINCLVKNVIERDPVALINNLSTTEDIPPYFICREIGWDFKDFNKWQGGLIDLPSNIEENLYNWTIENYKLFFVIASSN